MAAGGLIGAEATGAGLFQVVSDRVSNLREGQTGTSNTAPNKMANAEPAKNTQRWWKNVQNDGRVPRELARAWARRATSSCNRRRVAGGMDNESPAAARRRLA